MTTRISILALVAAATCVLPGCVSNRGPREPVGPPQIVEEPAPVSAPACDLSAPASIVLIDQDGHPVQYEAVWQVVDKKGAGRWVYRRVADRPVGSPNMQPGLLPQELGLITAESLRVNQQLTTELRSLTAATQQTRRELADLARRVAEKEQPPAQGAAAAADGARAAKPVPVERAN